MCDVFVYVCIIFARFVGILAALSPRDGPAHSNVRHVVADALLAAREKDRIDHEMDALEEKERKKQITGREKDLGHKVLPRQVPAKT
jgi:hypothetical protein